MMFYVHRLVPRYPWSSILPGSGSITCSCIIIRIHSSSSSSSRCMTCLHNHIPVIPGGCGCPGEVGGGVLDSFPSSPDGNNSLTFSQSQCCCGWCYHGYCTHTHTHTHTHPVPNQHSHTHAHTQSLTINTHAHTHYTGVISILAYICTCTHIYWVHYWYKSILSTNASLWCFSGIC